MTQCAPQRPRLPVPAEGLGRLMASPSWESWGIHTAHPLLCTPHQSRDRGVATLGQSVQSPFSQEIKKIYNLAGIQAGQGSGPFTQAPAACCARGSSIHRGHPGPLSPGSQQLETGPWSSRERHWWGLAGSPDGLLLWHLGQMARCRVRWEQAPWFLPGALGQDGSSLWCG